MGRKTKIDVSDLVDIFLVCRQKGEAGIDISYFLLDFFPNDMTQKDLDNYWKDLTLLFEEQRGDIEDLVGILKMRLFEEGKWKD